MDFADLEAKLADPQCSLMILCNPQNPSGRIWSTEELAKVGELAAANRVTVISDEIHCDLCDPGYEYVPFAGVSETCRMCSVTCVAPTKTFNLAGLNTAAVFAADPVLRHKVWRGINTDDVGEPGAFAIPATIAAFTKGAPWLDQLRAYIAGNKKLLADFLAKELPQLKLIEGPATYLCWVDCRDVTEDDKALQAHLRKAAGLFVSPGSAYGEAGRGFLRINMACPRSMVQDGLERLRKGIETWAK
jgi:cystathionine beta-lyase